MWTRPHETTDVLPIRFEVAGVVTTSFEVAIIAKYGPRPVTGYATAFTSAEVTGATVTGLPAGDYWAFPRKGATVLEPIWFRLT